MANIPIRDQVANYITRRAIAKELNIRPLGRQRTPIPDLPGVPDFRADPEALPPAPRFQPAPLPHGKKALPICIIGGGVCGLYAALCLELSGNTNYVILEASARPGGRVYTKRFVRQPAGPSDYFDVGAMRFPKIPVLPLTFELFDYLKDSIVLEPYHTSGPNNPMLFNSIHWPNSGDPAPGDHFKVSVSNDGTVPDTYVATGVDNLLDAAYGPFKQEFAENGFYAGFAKLLKFDNYTTRAYLSDETILNYPFSAVQWCETMDSATGLYDQAFTESVLDSLDFDFPGGANWYCLKGGTVTLIDALMNRLSTQPTYGQRVTAIAKNGDIMEVSVNNGPAAQYSKVITTVPLSCLRLIDLTRAELDYEQKVAVRSLHYDASVKVGMKFKTKWWSTEFGINEGGQGKTDEPIRVCAYPSYGAQDDPTKPAVLIASYTWSQDAQRIGSLVQGPGSNAESVLVDVVLKGLVRLHNKVNITYQYLKDELLEYYAHDWYRDEFTMGAFALFGPGQFTNLYPSLTRPAAGGYLHFAGEAVSTHHAWIEGSLSSANRAVAQVLVREGEYERIKEVEKVLGSPHEVEPNAVQWQTILGSRSPEEKPT